MKEYMNRRVTQPKRVTSPTWGPPPPCKQALSLSWPSPVLYRNLVLKYPFQSRPFYVMQLLYDVSTLFDELLSRLSWRLLNSAGVTMVTTAKILEGTQVWVNLIIMRKASRQAT